MARYRYIIGLGMFCLVLSSPLIPASGGQVSRILPQQIAAIRPTDGSQGPRLLVAFDLDALGIEPRIDFAQLVFRGVLQVSEETPSVVRLEALPILTDWQQHTVNWETPWKHSGGDVDTCARTTNWVLVGHSDTTVMWLDVTRIVTGWKDGTTPNHGVLVKISELTPAMLERIDLSSVELRVWHHAVRRP